MARVADLLESWALQWGLDEGERVRWRAVGFLHDALRDEPLSSLLPLAPADFGGLSDALLHGPAAAERLRTEGVADAELLDAVAFHTVGDPGFGRLGRALYVADFLEPGRTFLGEWGKSLRSRVPGALDEVVLEVARARIAHILDHKAALHPRTIAFWNALVEECHG